MKTYFFALAMLACAATLSAQTSSWPTPGTLKGKQFYVEGGGPGVVFSANYDSRFEQGATLGWGYRVGLGFDWIDEEDDWLRDDVHSFATIPIGINYVFGKTDSDHAFEAGAGLTLLTRRVSRYTYDGGAGHVMGHCSFMYRRQPVDGGFTWRIGLTPIIGTAGDAMISAAIGLGYSF